MTSTWPDEMRCTETVIVYGDERDESGCSGPTIYLRCEHRKDHVKESSNVAHLANPDSGTGAEVTIYWNVKCRAWYQGKYCSKAKGHAGPHYKSIEWEDPK